MLKRKVSILLMYWRRKDEEALGTIASFNFNFAIFKTFNAANIFQQ